MTENCKHCKGCCQLPCPRCNGTGNEPHADIVYLKELERKLNSASLAEREECQRIIDDAVARVLK